MKLSVVTTLFYSEPFVAEFYSRASKAVSAITSEYEIIFINDGSPDHSKELALELQRQDPRITVIDLSRNFGHHKAMMTGLNFASGDYIFLIDSDLEEDPELLTGFWNEMKSADQTDVVYGIQQKRKGGWFERFSGRIYYRLFSRMTGIKYPSDSLTSRLMTKRYVDALKQFSEKEFDIWSLFVLNGFTQKGIMVQKGHKASTTYTFRRKLRMAVDMVTSLTTGPLYLISAIGIIITVVAVVYGLRALYYYVANGSFNAWSLTLASVWFIGGAILLSLGLIGIYISKMYLEIKNRPVSIIKNIYRA